MQYNDLTGKRFGRLKVIRYDHSDKNRNAVFLCKCDCGNEKMIMGRRLITRTKPTRSCGCLQKEKAKQHLSDLEKMGLVKHNQRRTHGMSKKHIYKVWINMRKRCFNKNHEHYKYYGYKGIKVCDEWNNSFESFYKWALSNGYEKNLTIERIDVNKDYCPENCTWISQKKQIRNRTNTVFIKHNGTTKPMIEWCEIYGVNYKIAHQRYKKGMPFEKVFYNGNLRTFHDKHLKGEEI